MTNATTAAPVTEVTPENDCECKWSDYSLHTLLLESETSPAALRTLVSMTVTQGECDYSDMLPHAGDIEDFFACHNWQDPIAMRELAVVLHDIWCYWREKEHYKHLVESARVVLAPGELESRIW